MPETEESAGTNRPAAGPVRRVRRRRHRPLIVRFWWVVPVVAILAAAPAIWTWLLNPHFRHDPLPGYIADHSRLEEEYLLFTGKPLDPSATGDFDQATSFMLEGKYVDAAIVLESAAKQIPVPAVFNDLGVLYVKANDGTRAVRAFRDALARNHDYPPVRANLKRMHLSESIDPGSTEVEPNDDPAHANVVWLNRPVNANIAPSVGDVDCYWFTTPRPPRDRISIQVINRSPTLNPRLRISDDSGRLVTGVKEATGKGESLRFDFSPPPNTFYAIQVDGASGTSGDYRLAVEALHAYDVYEPNDTLLTATRIGLGQTIDANIMDADDTDYFSFLSPVAAFVSIDLVSRNDTLVPGLSSYAPDLSFIGFAADAKGPGGSIHHTMQLEANQFYYLQVFSKNETTGPYSLTVK
jgi:hypothetical protein